MELVEDNASVGAKTAQTVSFVLGGNFASLLLSAVLFIFLTRALGPANYGIYTLAIAFAGIFGSVGNFGIAITLNKFVSQITRKNQEKELNKTILNGIFLAFVVGIILSAVTFLLSGTFAVLLFNNSGLTFIFQLAAATLFCALFEGSLIGILVGRGRGLQVLYVNLVQSFFQIVVSVSLFFAGFGAAAPVIGLIFGYLSGAFAALYYINKLEKVKWLRSELSKTRIRKFFSFSLPVALSSVSVNILPDLSIVTFGIFESAAIVGNFGVAAKINTLLYTIVINSVAFSLLSTFTATLTNKRSAENIGMVYNYSVFFAFLLLVPGILFIAIMATPLSYTLFGGNYTLAPEYIAIITAGFTIWIIGAFASNVLVSSGRVWEVLKYNVIVDAIVIGILPVVYGFSNGIGIVLDVFVLAPILYDLIFFLKIRNIFKIKLDSVKLSRVIIANLVIVLLIYLTDILLGTNYVILIVISLIELVVLYPLFAAVLGGVSASDLKLIESTTQKIPFVRLIASYFVAYARLVVR